MLALVIGMIAAAAVGYLVGLIALRRTGIYFAMITVAIAEVFFFVEFNPLVGLDRRRERPAGRADAELQSRLHDAPLHHRLVALSVSRAVLLRRHRDRAAHRALAGRRDPAARSATIRCAPTAVGHNIHGYKLTAFVIAAAYAGFAGGLLGVLQAFMPPDAFTFDTSGQLVMQTAIGGRGTLFGPLVGAAVWLFLQDFLQAALGLGAAWKLVLGVVFVLLVCFLRRGIVGGIEDLYGWISAAQADRGRRRGRGADAAAADGPESAERRGRRRAGPDAAPARPASRRVPARSCRRPASPSATAAFSPTAISISPSTSGELRGIIGPNGAGKSTFFKMLTCEVPPTSGRIVFEGRDITGMNVTDVCQLGLTKSYQVNQLFTGLTVRENLSIAALAELRGQFRLDLFRSVDSVPGLHEQVEHTLELVNLDRSRPTRRYPSSPTARSAGSRSASRSRPRRACCCSTSRSPA